MEYDERQGAAMQEAQCWLLGDLDDVSADEEVSEWRQQILCDGSEVAAAYAPTADEAVRLGRLLAAVPNLLAACESVLSDLDDKIRWTSVSRRFAAQKLRAAVTKARQREG